jgi:preprotein translocase subunit SecA
VQVMRDAPMDLPAVAPRSNIQELRGALPADVLESGRHAPPAARPTPAPRTATGEKVGRNDPCPCGSGKKYKKCCYLKGA